MFPATAATGASPSPPYTAVEYRGTLLYEAHARHPGDIRPYHALERFVTDGHDRARMDGTTWKDGDTVMVFETYLLLGDRLFHRDSPGQPWRTYAYASKPERRMRLEGTAGLPALLERVTRARRDSLDDWQRDRGRLRRYTRLWAHPRLGDVRDSVEYFYRGTEPLPDSMAMAVYHRDANYRILLRRVSWSHAAIAESLFAAPDSSELDPPEDPDGVGAVPPLVEVAPGLWSVELSDIDSRTLIVEFADHLAVLEVAVGSANGERIVDAARRHWPSKPIRYALFSHYHPHYTGGLRAMMAEGATVVTTPGNEAFVRHLAELPFVSQPDRYARHPRPPKVVTFADRYELADSTNRLVAIDYGARSDHTDEFVVFWFPRQKLMFEAEQGWSTVNGSLRAGRRARSLLAWLPEQKLEVDRFLQCWPMRDNAAMVTRAQLDSLVQVKR